MTSIYFYIILIDNTLDKPVAWINHRLFNDLYEVNEGNFIVQLNSLPIVNPKEFISAKKLVQIPPSISFSVFKTDSYEMID